MPNTDTDDIIKDSIRLRVIEAIDEQHFNGERLSYTKIMEEIGDHQQSLAQYRIGKRSPTLKNVVLLCTRFGYNETWVLFGTGSKKKKKSKDLNDRIIDAEKEISDIKKALKTSKK